MKNFRQKPPDALSDSNEVQEFMRFMEQAFARHQLWAGCNQEDVDAAVEVRMHGHGKSAALACMGASGHRQRGVNSLCPGLIYAVTHSLLHSVSPTLSSPNSFPPLQGLEKYLLTKLWDRTFAQDIMDRERDAVLAAR